MLIYKSTVYTDNVPPAVLITGSYVTHRGIYKPPTQDVHVFWGYAEYRLRRVEVVTYACNPITPLHTT